MSYIRARTPIPPKWTPVLYFWSTAIEPISAVSKSGSSGSGRRAERQPSFRTGWRKIVLSFSGAVRPGSLK